MRVSARLSRVAVATVLIIVAPPLALSDQPKARMLPALAANISETSVSGISSGAYMAGQFQIAHSKIVTGAAIIAGGPYGCAESLFADMMPGPGAAFFNLSKAVNGCMLNSLALWGVPNPSLLAEKTVRLADEGKIDPIASLTADRVYFFSGTEDHTVVPAIVASAVDYYRDLGLKPDQLKVVTDIGAGHAFVTDGEGLACPLTGEPYVVNCDYDQAGDLLKHIYGPLKPRATEPAGRFVDFDQTAFTGEELGVGLAEQGVVYIPAQCEKTTTCRVHIAFHGCQQDRATVGDAFIHESGFARWADSNDLIVLFPQVSRSAFNPQTCWDWWGYTGGNYLTQDAPQIAAVYRMLQRLNLPRSTT